MELEKDAFGQEILACHEGRDAFEIVERDDGYMDLSYGPGFYFAEYKDWPKIEKQAIKLAKGNVLDIGAGAGRVALYLQEKNINVTSIDNSPLAIKVCKERGAKDVRVLPIEQISKFKPGSFDTVLMLGNNFGLFGDWNKAKKLLKVMHKITTPKALIIAETNDYNNTDNSAHLNYQIINKNRGRMPGQLRIRIRFNEFTGYWMDYLFITKKELEEIIIDTGWKVKKYIDSEKATYIAVLEKI